MNKLPLEIFHLIISRADRDSSINLSYTSQLMRERCRAHPAWNSMLLAQLRETRPHHFLRFVPPDEEA